MMFPRVYMDNTARKAVTGYLGAARLLECLKRYKRHVPTTTGEPAGPVYLCLCESPLVSGPPRGGSCHGALSEDQGCDQEI